MCFSSLFFPVDCAVFIIDAWYAKYVSNSLNSYFGNLHASDRAVAIALAIYEHKGWSWKNDLAAKLVKINCRVLYKTLLWGKLFRNLIAMLMDKLQLLQLTPRSSHTQSFVIVFTLNWSHSSNAASSEVGLSFPLLNCKAFDQRL